MMQSKIESLEEYNSKSIECDCIWFLLKEIQGIVAYSFRHHYNTLFIAFNAVVSNMTAAVLGITKILTPSMSLSNGAHICGLFDTATQTRFENGFREFLEKRTPPDTRPMACAIISRRNYADYLDCMPTN
jgi:hypothetical protein